MPFFWFIVSCHTDAGVSAAPSPNTLAFYLRLRISGQHEMRHSCIFATVPLLALTLAGCGPDSSSDSNYINPATSVSLSFESFAVRNEEGLPPELPHTIFYDVYRGIEPADGEDDGGVVTQLRDRLELLMGLEPSDDETTYTSARNPLDFLHHIISTNQVNTFNDGRRLMRDSITKGEASRYNTPANNVLVRFTETGGNNGEPPEPDQIWVYVMLDWTSNPQLNKVFRAAQFVARPPADDDPSPPEVRSAVWSGRFHGPDFSVSGYNQPEYAAVSLTGREFGNAEMRQAFIGDKFDTLSLTKTSGITIDGEEPDCIRVDVDYVEARVRVFTSSGEPASNTSNGITTANPAHCGNQQNGEEAVSYQSVVISERQ